MQRLKLEGRARPDGNIFPPEFSDWFAHRGWTPRSHQVALVEAAQDGENVLLIAPTGGGKTLAGFLPTLIDLAAQSASLRGGRERPHRLHTLYISPLKALAVDIARNLEIPVSEMALDVRIETRTGDTPQSRRRRQRMLPPDILLTTPEQLALMLSYKESGAYFASLECVVLDELHALINKKRGELLALGLARLSTIAPGSRRVGLSATVADPDRLRRFLAPQSGARAEINSETGEVLRETEPRLARLVTGDPGAPPAVRVLESSAHIPWSGHTARHAMPEVYKSIREADTALIFVNTRSQAEIVFQELWNLNDDALPIALHHGSLSPEQRRKVEAAMARGELRAVVCTSTLDLGIDWGAVDLVIHIGAPKGASRLLQRIGRANHRLDEPSRALLVPSNRFEVLECEAARGAVHEGMLDDELPRLGGYDVLAQHILGMACAAPFDADDFFREVTTAEPYAHLTRERFDRVVDFVATGGYALRSYDRYWRLRKTDEGLFRVANPRVAQQYRMNVGTIVELPMLKVRLVRRGRGKQLSKYKGPDGRPVAEAPPPMRGGRVLGEIEEGFIDQLTPGDTFLFAGQVLRFEGIRETEAYASRAPDKDAMVPAYAGGKFPLSTFLADRVRQILADPGSWSALPGPVAEWLRIQKWRSILPGAGELLVETFPRGDRHYLVCYPFDGRLAHQTLGMLLTRRLERAGLRPLGFVATEYSLAVWGLRDLGQVDLASLFDEDMLGDDLDEWLAESYLLKRTFRTCATIAGLIERRHPGQEKTGRQMTVSSDLIYDVLRQYEPDHILMQATWHDAAGGLLDVQRLGLLLRRIQGHIVPRRLDRVSPLAVPVLLEIGKEPVSGDAHDALLNEAADSLIEEATRLV